MVTAASERLLTIMANRFVKLIFTLMTAFLLSSVGLVLYYRFFPVRLTPLMLIRQSEARRQGYMLPIQQQWTPIEDISPELIKAVVDSEDARFFEHYGFDIDAIASAYHINQANGHIVRGGSSISQQTAKNVFCTPARTYIRKAFEAYFTVLVEFLWGKERILEVYLNVIELGEGIYGVEAASQYYFGHSAEVFSSAQIGQLVRIIPCPLCQPIRCR